MIINDKGLRLEEIDRCFDCINKGGCAKIDILKALKDKGENVIRYESCKPDYKQSEIKYNI